MNRGVASNQLGIETVRPSLTALCGSKAAESSLVRIN